MLVYSNNSNKQNWPHTRTPGRDSRPGVPETGEWGEEMNQSYARRLRDGFSLATLSPSSPIKGNADEQVPWESILPRTIHSASVPDTSQKLTLASLHKQNQKTDTKSQKTTLIM